MFGYSVAEPHHFYAAPAPGKNIDAAPAAKLLYLVDIILYYLQYIAENMN
jgi:hypothetical protein